MADIQAMYYQVKVPESQRSYLRYLWWKERYTNFEILDHEMCVYLLEEHPILVVVIMPRVEMLLKTVVPLV